MKLFGLAAIIAFVAIGAEAHAQPYAELRGIFVARCEGVDDISCVRILPKSLEALHRFERKAEPWVTPYEALSEAEVSAMHALRDALLARSGDPVPDAYKLPRYEFRSADWFFDSFDEARLVLADDKCATADVVSLNREEDTVERYAMLEFKCEKGGESLSDYVAVAMRDSRVIRIHVNWMDKVYYDLAPKKPPAE